MIKLAAERANTIYIAGPMTGYENYNFDNFNRVAAIYEAKGYIVKNPATHGVVEGATWEDYMAYDLTQLGECGNIYMLKGWQGSKGASTEHFLASALKMTITYEEEIV